MAEAKKHTVEELMERLSWAGIDPGETLDDFKKNHNAKYFTEDTFFESESFKKKIGGINGSLLSKTKAISKQFGIELTKEEVGEKKTEELIELAMTKLQEKNNTIQKDLEEKVGKTSDEKFKEVNEKFNKKSLDFETVAEENKRLKEEKEKDKIDYAQNIKSEKLIMRKKDMWAKFKWGVDNELQRKGFEAVIEEKYDWDLDEQQELIPLDKKTKSKIPNPKVNSTFLNASEVLETEGITAKVFNLNKDGGKGNGNAGTGFFDRKPDEKHDAQLGENITKRADGRVLVTAPISQ